MRASACVFASLLVAASGAACSREPGPAASATSRPAKIRLATTTSARDSGLLDALLPAYRAKTGDKVDVVAVGTGAAFKLASDGNADLLLVHDEKSEQEFIVSGHGRERRPLCWNTFEILGPPDDPAEVAGSKDAPEALRRIAAAGASFVSRGDDSGTHKRELALWRSTGGLTKWPGYKETGQGMGATLTVADELPGYVLADRGTVLSFRSKIRLTTYVTGSPELRNTYSVVLLDAKRHPEIASQRAQDLADWLTGPDAAKRIGDFRTQGEALFVPLHAER